MTDIITDLNEFLSDLNVFYRKLQNYHWNIEGKSFFVLHAKLEEYYDEVNKQIDEIAEHILMLNGQPLGTLKDYMEKTTIGEAENKKVKEDEVFQKILQDYKTLLQKVTQIKKKADENDGYLTSSMMDEYIANYSKNIWMLTQSMK